MRTIVFRVLAVAAAVGVGVVVVSGGHGCTPRGDSAPPVASAEGTGRQAAATSASAAPPVLDDEDRGVIGPSTKADPHAIRRAVRGLASGAASASSSAAPPAGR